MKLIKGESILSINLGQLRVRIKPFSGIMDVVVLAIMLYIIVKGGWTTNKIIRYIVGSLTSKIVKTIKTEEEY